MLDCGNYTGKRTPKPLVKPLASRERFFRLAAVYVLYTATRAKQIAQSVRSLPLWRYHDPISGTSGAVRGRTKSEARAAVKCERGWSRCPVTMQMHWVTA